MCRMTGAQGVFHFKIEADMRLDAALVGKGSGDGKFNLSSTTHCLC